LNVAWTVCEAVPPESLTVTVTLNAPDAVGVPEITPVAAAMLNPAGRPVADHVKEGTPPVAATVVV
jgi:hypothetical protein